MIRLALALAVGAALSSGGVVAATSVAAPHPSGLHPDSLTSSAIEVIGRQVHLLMRCQVLSLLEVIPDLDADGDGRIAPDEVGRVRVPIVDYIDGHYSLVVGSDRALRGGVRLTPAFLRLDLLGPETEGGRGYRMGAVELELLYEAEAEIQDLLLDSTLFEDTSPGHIDLVELRWQGHPAEHFALTAERRQRRSDPEGRGAFAAYLPLGVRHILGGWDHLVFVFVLVLGARRLRSVLAVITAFTVAHSVTLVLATLDVVDARPWARLVEALIALSIAYVAADIAVFPDRLRLRWGEAFTFGLVHGFGFAAFLRESLVSEAAKPLALLGFNAGIEVGQVPVAFAAAGLLRLLPRRATASDGVGPAAGGGGATPGAPALAPRSVRRWLGAAIAAVGLWAFVTRLWGG